MGGIQKVALVVAGLVSGWGAIACFAYLDYHNAWWAVGVGGLGAVMLWFCLACFWIAEGDE